MRQSWVEWINNIHCVRQSPPQILEFRDFFLIALIFPVLSYFGQGCWKFINCLLFLDKFQCCFPACVNKMLVEKLKNVFFFVVKTMSNKFKWQIYHDPFYLPSASQKSSLNTILRENLNWWGRSKPCTPQKRRFLITASWITYMLVPWVGNIWLYLMCAERCQTNKNGNMYKIIANHNRHDSDCLHKVRCVLEQFDTHIQANDWWWLAGWLVTVPTIASKSECDWRSCDNYRFEQRENQENKHNLST